MSKKIYDYDKCFEIAKQCTSSTEMRNLNGSAYNVARNNKWIKDYNWFVRKQHTPYTYEEVYEIAKKYTCSSEFQKGDGSAYGKARSNGWIEDYSWFKRKQKPNGYWNNYERCFNEAKSYNTRTTFMRGNGAAYAWALKNGWLDDYTWFHLMQRPSGYWTKERVVEESRKYKTRGEFHDNNGTAYSKARINGWLDELTWLKDERIDFSTDKIDCVYAYEFREFNSVYVGRTLLRRVKDRDKEHLFVDKDTVSLFVKKHDIPIPDMKVLEDNLTIAEGVEKENYYIKQYQKEGWQIINRAKAGSIGLLAKNKWSKKTCYEEALKYKSRTDFSKHGGGAYEIARQNGWLDDYVWFEEKIKKHGFWHDYKNCYNAARKCSDVTEFIKEYGPAYINAKKNDWLKDYTWFRAPLRVRKWTYDACFAIAKKYNYQSDFRKNDLPAYDAAKRNGWLNGFDWLIHHNKKPSGYWKYDTCFEEAKKYKSGSEFQRMNQTAWIVSRKNKWLKDYTWFVKPNIKWNYDTCWAIAKTCKSRHEFGRRYSGAYNVARKNGWLDEYTWFVKKPNAKWTYDKCKELAKTVRGRDDFAKKYGERAASTCRKNNWFDEFFPQEK